MIKWFSSWLHNHVYSRCTIFAMTSMYIYIYVCVCVCVCVCHLAVRAGYAPKTEFRAATEIESRDIRQVYNCWTGLRCLDTYIKLISSGTLAISACIHQCNKEFHNSKLYRSMRWSIIINNVGLTELQQLRIAGSDPNVKDEEGLLMVHKQFARVLNDEDYRISTDSVIRQIREIQAGFNIGSTAYREGVCRQVVSSFVCSSVWLGYA